MSFMFNPHPFDDANAINKINLDESSIAAIVSGKKEPLNYFSDFLNESIKQNPERKIFIALDGYISAQFDGFVEKLCKKLTESSVNIKLFNVSEILKSSELLEEQFSENLPDDKAKDPVLLFGKLFKGKYEDLMDAVKLNELELKLDAFKNDAEVTDTVVIVYGCGAAMEKLRAIYDYILFFDVTSKQAILRAKKGLYANIGDLSPKPFKTLLRRCYYVDFELAGHLRWDLLRQNKIDFYIASDDPDNIDLIPKNVFDKIMGTLVKQPFRCKPVYIEGVWGGHYITKQRGLPDTMRNCAWSFELIPLEVSILVQAGEKMLEFPYFTFVQKEGEALMGRDCVEKFDGYFPVRFNYDDTFHSSGNMSIQVHSGKEYNLKNYGEHGSQDESYYIVATGHGAKTYIGFSENKNPQEFIDLAKQSETDGTVINYEAYIDHVKSEPGAQVLIPAGTIHASGRNQLILEIGSLTVGSYTYKMYDYLRADLDGKPRPIHTYHGENVLALERDTNWVHENAVQQPQLVRQGNTWAEYIVGEHELIYFSLRRLEFENTIEDNTNGKFHVLTLVDGETVRVEALDNSNLSYTMNYLDIVVVPANIGRYVIRNQGNQPVCIHKAMLKNGFENNA